jgi:RNA polymerase sigma factor (sigma-70 family)
MTTAARIGPPKSANRRGPAERDRLVLQFKHLPARVAARLRRHPAVARLGFDDAVQAGFLGLLRAAELWDDSRGVLFLTYAYQSVKMSILKAALGDGLIVVPLWVFLREGGKRHLAAVRRAQHYFSLYDQNERHGFQWEPPDRRDRIDYCDYLTVLEALGRLEPLEQDVIRWCVMDGETLSCVGRRLGVSKEWVRQIRERGLARLRRKLGVAEAEACAAPGELP